jgi:DnaJ-class molecular chaperone
MRDDYYETLGVERSASQDDIRIAYFRLVQAYHPDKIKGQNTFAYKRFQLIGEAYQHLKTPEHQAKYNAYLDEKEHLQIVPGNRNFSGMRPRNVNTGFKNLMSWLFEPFSSSKKQKNS